MKLFTYVLGSIAGILAVIGLLFKIQHWPGAGILLVIGLAGIAVFIPVYAYYRYNKGD